MTRALDTLNATEGDIGEGSAKAQEPAYVKPTHPVIPVPASANASKLTAAIEAARIANERKRERLLEARAQLDESLSDAEPDRVDLQLSAEELLNAAVNGEETRDAARILAKALADRQELIRDMKKMVGVTVPEITSYGENIEEKLAAIIGANATMREIIRNICANAGTVRIDELIPLKTSGGRLILQHRFADVGDEEPDQEPIADLKWILPAGIKAAARFSRLMQAHTEASKRAIEAEMRAEAIQRRLTESETERTRLKTENTELQAQVGTHRPNAPGTPTGYYLRSEDGRWIAKYEGKHECFITRWRSTDNMRNAHRFEFKEEAAEVLARLQFVRLHRLDKSVRETLRVVSVRFEDHSE